MHWHDWYNLFIEQMKHTSLIEWLAVAFGVAEVLLARVNNIWLYPMGILGTVLGIYLLLDVQLYAESLLNVYYLVMSFYGWYLWVRKSDKPPVKISYSTAREWVVTMVIIIVGGVFLYYVLKTYTPSNVPALDAFVAATGWAGMWLLAKRKIENWVILNISNIVAIPLLFYKKLPMLAALTAFLFIVAIWGFFDWRKIYNKEKSPATY
ncbi:nicotinamide riboside transporter PnuC [Mucilaginibacter paludis]|uniref:Nicotinamide riboside transporter PnuC n=1 Tax=Mucilaginibacter paludis DSM 18603 TaxID=714943 RepID=H1Y4Q6_9SPHI|nr:nicotinamide riboside transporter PnuC [Mucilaginibacter paludis]EHQ28100.1 nicotinamide mononucleotide transporter PnuC [Mucilaginibacter paludis DSM 18603]